MFAWLPELSLLLTNCANTNTSPHRRNRRLDATQHPRISEIQIFTSAPDELAQSTQPLHPKFCPSGTRHPTRWGPPSRSRSGSDWVHFLATSDACCIALTPYSPPLRQVAGVDASGATGDGESIFSACNLRAGSSRKFRGGWGGRILGSRGKLKSCNAEELTRNEWWNFWLDLNACVNKK